jgi:hypothetical protein
VTYAAWGGTEGTTPCTGKNGNHPVGEVWSGVVLAHRGKQRDDFMGLGFAYLCHEGLGFRYL